MSNEEKSLALKPAPLAMGETGLVVETMDDLWRIATAVARTAACPKDASVDDVFIAMVKGGELGFSPMQSVHSIPVVKGRPTLEGKACLALIRSKDILDPRGGIDAGCRGEGDQREGWCRSWRKGEPEPHETTFTWAQAANAGLTGKTRSGQPGMYMKYGEDMLKWKAVGRHADTYYSDVTHGLMMEVTGQEVYGTTDVTVSTSDPEMSPTPSAPDPLLQLPSNSDAVDAEIVEAVTGDPVGPEEAIPEPVVVNGEIVDTDPFGLEEDSPSVCGVCNPKDEDQFCMDPQDQGEPHDWERDDYSLESDSGE